MSELAEIRYRWTCPHTIWVATQPKQLRVPIEAGPVGVRPEMAGPRSTIDPAIDCRAMTCKGCAPRRRAPRRECEVRASAGARHDHLRL